MSHRSVLDHLSDESGCLESIANGHVQIHDDGVKEYVGAQGLFNDIDGILSVDCLLNEAHLLDLAEQVLEHKQIVG